VVINGVKSEEDGSSGQSQDSSPSEDGGSVGGQSFVILVNPDGSLEIINKIQPQLGNNTNMKCIHYELILILLKCHSYFSAWSRNFLCYSSKK
jgi:hypothetical protein